MRLYALSFSTENFGNGIALVVASKNKEAFALLQRQGQLNATPEEYTLKASLDISDSNICSPTLIYEEYSGVRTVVGPPGTGIETINVDENGYLVVVLTDGTVQTSTNSLKGPKGDDAKINGYNTINIEAGENITLDQEDNTLTIDIAEGAIPDVSNFITKSVDDLTNYYLKSETYTKDEVTALIGAIQQFHYEIYPSISSITNPESNVLYLIGPTGTGSDKYEEYVYDSTKQDPFVKIGDTSIDSSFFPWRKGQGQDSAELINNAILSDGNVASGMRSVAEGGANWAIGDYSHVEGYSSQSSGTSSHAEGQRTIAQGNYSHSEGIGGIQNAGVRFSGSGTSYTTNSAHGFAVGTVLKYRDIVAKVVSIPSSTSFTTDTALSETAVSLSNDLYVVTGVAVGSASHSEGDSSLAVGNYSHTEGLGSMALNEAEHAEGSFNKSHKASSSFGNSGNTIHSIGIGTSNSNRRNAVEVMQNGNVYIRNINGYDGTNPVYNNSLQAAINNMLSLSGGVLTGDLEIAKAEASFTVRDTRSSGAAPTIRLIRGTSSDGVYDGEIVADSTAIKLRRQNAQGGWTDVLAGNSLKLEWNGKQLATEEYVDNSLADYTTTESLTTLLAGKQDVIQDLESIRAGATAGATAYQKPQSGIPASDLASGVIPDVSGFYEKPSGGIPSSDMTEAVQTSLGKADTALQSFTETDPTVPSWAKATNPPTEIFWAEYGVTTAAEVQSALDSNKLVLVRDSAGRNCLYFRQDDYFMWFGGISSNQSTYIALTKANNAWSFGGNINLELQGNKKTAITGNESSDTYYPSTKAVADYVAENKELFVATPNVTTFSEIQAAVSTGKAIIAIRDNGTVYTLSSIASSFCYFSSINGTTAQYYIVQSSGWSPGQGALELTEKRVSSWRSTPDNSHYPSEKLVKDSLDAIHPVPAGGSSGQVLSKASGTDYDTEWVTPSSGSSDAVQYTPQTLTDAQKAQARVNIQTLHANFGETITPVTTGAETTQNKAQTLVGNEDDTTKYPSTKAVADALGKWGVVSQTITFNIDGTRTLSNVERGIIPISEHKMYLLAGALFNDTNEAIDRVAPWGETVSHLPGYYYLNGLGDISADEMREIYVITNNMTYDITRYRFVRTNIRTVIPSRNGSYNWRNAVDGSCLFAYCNNLEVAHYSDIPISTDYINMPKLTVMQSFFMAQKVVYGGIWDVRSANTISGLDSQRLQYIYLYGLKANVSFANSANLKTVCIVYMINNSGTANFTITLHATAYARAIADADVQTALSNHTNVTLASN